MLLHGLNSILWFNWTNKQNTTVKDGFKLLMPVTLVSRLIPGPRWTSKNRWVTCSYWSKTFKEDFHDSKVFEYMRDFAAQQRCWDGYHGHTRKPYKPVVKSQGDCWSTGGPYLISWLFSNISFLLRHKFILLHLDPDVITLLSSSNVFLSQVLLQIIWCWSCHF